MNDRIQLPPGAELGEFKPCVAYFDDLRMTQILLADASVLSVPLKIPGVEGHCVDLLYDMYTDELVGVQIWDDVRKPVK